MSFVIGIFILTAIVFSYFAYRWESTLKRPSLGKNLPLVSILIPAYKSEKTIERCIKSALNLDYPKKEIFVVNDSKDNTPKICKRLGVKCIQNKKRLGKSVALNEAVKQTSGDILFFLDADTIARKDSLKRLVPWFDKKTMAVVPKYIAQNPKTLVEKLVSIENSFMSSLFKMHMYFGSMIAFRGCGVAIKRSGFENLGGWPKTQMEDNEFAAIIHKNGYKIQYEPTAVVETRESKTLSELKKQRMRWGKGAFYTFWNHKSGYKTSNQFLVSTLPYTILGFVLIGFLLLTIYSLLPAISFLSFTSFQQSFFISLNLIWPILINFLAVVAIATVSHFTLLTYHEHPKKSSLIYLVPFIFFYILAILAFYIKGIMAGIKDKIIKRDELDFDNW